MIIQKKTTSISRDLIDLNKLAAGKTRLCIPSPLLMVNMILKRFLCKWSVQDLATRLQFLSFS